MIAEIRGTLTATSVDTVTVMTPAGLGYAVAVPTTALSRLPPVGGEVHLHTALVVREDDWALYGFPTARERLVFRRMLLASGVGPRLALAVVSTLGVDRVVRAVRDSDYAALCTVSGIGRKKAERMVLELKDRLGDLEVPETPTGATPAGTEAVLALVNLGYPRIAAEAAVHTALATDADAGTPDLIRIALETLVSTS